MEKYLHKLVLWLLLIGALFFCAIYLVDPYDYWGHKILGKLTAAKPEAGKHLRYVKAQQYFRIKPKTLIVGNSRVAVGMDPISFQNATNGRVYNFGLPGEYITSIVAQVEQLLPVYKPEKILIDLNFADFPTSSESWEHYDPTGVALTYRSPDPFKQFVETGFSLSALIDTANTISESSKKMPHTTTVNGFMGMEWMADSIFAEGVASVFKMKLTADSLILANKFRGKHVAWPGPGKNPIANRLDEFVKAAQAQGIEVVLFVSPVHKLLTANYDAMGLAPEKSQFLTIAKDIAVRNHIKFFNFDVQSAFQREALPDPGSKQQKLRWYWEGSHYKPALGQLMFNCMGSEKPREAGSCLQLEAKIILP